MGAPATEVTIVPLAKGADPRVEDSEAAITLDRSIQDTIVQPGYRRMVWGLDKEDPTVIVMIAGESFFEYQMKSQDNIKFACRWDACNWASMYLALTTLLPLYFCPSEQ
ncbi:Dimeric alpha-beta barrel [Penicillium robsamsonii]|uniref:Dimeric alpha-beta barrel n=1 Tax=Penicillium robsamsonii TaxID=1792511 RepID=UPI002548EB19|nr:Dimeric alpha-beta barrel [Penicillium robsamsonii]KAJ5827458.1 Dimeric alpha-beta barrel [Penicillium robsamsonii]